MTTPRSRSDLLAGAHEVATEWRSLAQAVSLALDSATPGPLGHALKDSILTLDRSLILFLCGGEAGGRDHRDIEPADFLGRDWFPTDDEMDQRLRGRLRVISKNRSHLTWHRVEVADVVMWPLALLAWETSWAFGQFISSLRSAGSPVLTIFEAAEQDVVALLPEKDFRASTYEYGKARPGQTQH